jgi:diguanylate cyclase (GGDEF)-like protein
MPSVTTIERAYQRLSSQTTFGDFVTTLLQVGSEVFQAQVTAFADAVRGDTWRFEVMDSVRIDRPMRVSAGALRYGYGDDLNAPFLDGPKPYALAALGRSSQRLGWFYLYDMPEFDDVGRERFESFALFAGAVLENVRLLEAAQRAALTDALTNLPNRRAIEEHLYELIKKREPVTLVLIDVNNFKEINDTLGHDGGDKALIDIANALTSSKRRDDFVGRLGGDEFVAICSGDGAHPLIERARKILAERDISFSAGFAKCPEDGESLKALYTSADSNMYDEKDAFHGKDRAGNRRH